MPANITSAHPHHGRARPTADTGSPAVAERAPSIHAADPRFAALSPAEQDLYYDAPALILEEHLRSGSWANWETWNAEQKAKTVPQRVELSEEERAMICRATRHNPDWCYGPPADAPAPEAPAETPKESLATASAPQHLSAPSPPVRAPVPAQGPWAYRPRAEPLPSHLKPWRPRYD